MSLNKSANSQSSIGWLLFYSRPMADRPSVDGRLDGHAVDQFSANYRRAIGRDLDTILLSQVNGFFLNHLVLTSSPNLLLKSLKIFA